MSRKESVQSSIKDNHYQETCEKIPEKVCHDEPQ